LLAKPKFPIRLVLVLVLSAAVLVLVSRLLLACERGDSIEYEYEPGRAEPRNHVVSRASDFC
jgi:hypothetical protein